MDLLLKYLVIIDKPTDDSVADIVKINNTKICPIISSK